MISVQASAYGEGFETGKAESADEIARLRADLSEARGIIGGFLADHPEETEREIQQGVANALDILDATSIDVVHPIVRHARAFLDRTGK